ncbi:MAG TPA: SGNH/GDSL hydrolase family protein [Longimicrobiaceae bacterium]|nr:SGNH/GDSL hydrolase family protein [Longimicrobiaceae bacterium]
MVTCRQLRLAALALVVLATPVGAHAQQDRSAGPDSAGAWVSTWRAAQQLTEKRNLPPAPGLSGNTLRQVVHVSIGGERLRVRFSNAFGNAPVTIQAAHIAPSAGGSAIDPSGDRALRFGGSESVTIPAGEAVVSDALDYPLKPLSNVAITLHFGGTSRNVTGHPGSRTTSYLQAGDAVTATDLAGAATADHWYNIAGIDVVAPRATAIAILGNSITDGRGSTTNGNDRWPDNLARRLQANPATRGVAVLNQGIGGNCVVRFCLGPPALARFDRDVLRPNGVRWLIVFEGVNDIGGSRGAEASARVARELIAAYRQFIGAAHAHGIAVYGATITPFGGSFYDSPEHEAARRTVNDWIRSSGAFDAVIDLDAAVRDPAHPSALLPAADSGDHLHPNQTGYRMMADAIDLGLFAR